MKRKNKIIYLNNEHKHNLWNLYNKEEKVKFIVKPDENHKVRISIQERDVASAIRDGFVDFSKITNMKSVVVNSSFVKTPKEELKTKMNEGSLTHYLKKMSKDFDEDNFLKNLESLRILLNNQRPDALERMLRIPSINDNFKGIIFEVLENK